MLKSSPSRRGSRIWRASCLSAIICLAARSSCLGAQEDARSQPAVSPLNELVLIPAPGEISIRTGDPPCNTLGFGAPLVRYLVDELINQRLQNAQLITDLAAADAHLGEIEKAVREKETALAAWIAGLHDELAQRRAEALGARLLEEARAAEASARARRQLAALKTKLKEQDRQMAIVQSAAEDLRRRLGAAEAELERREAENERLTADLGALRMKTRSAPVLAHLSAGPNEDQIAILRQRPEQPTELLSANWVDGATSISHPMPRLRASEVEAWALASDTSNGGAAGPAEGHLVIEDVAWTQAGLLEVAAARDWELTTDTIPFFAPESPYVLDSMSRADLAPNPFFSPMLEPGEESSTGLQEAAARLADGLRATREQAILQQQDRVFAIDVDKRTFINPAAESVALDPALDISLLTARSELIGQGTGGIRFFPDGSSTGGRVELELLGDRAAVNIRWATGAVTLER